MSSTGCHSSFLKRWRRPKTKLKKSEYLTYNTFYYYTGCIAMRLNVSSSGCYMTRVKQSKPCCSPIPPDYREASLFRLRDSSIVPQHSIKRYIKVRICTRWQALRITVMTGLILICHTEAAVLNWDCFIINQKEFSFLSFKENESISTDGRKLFWLDECCLRGVLRSDISPWK